MVITTTINNGLNGVYINNIINSRYTPVTFVSAANVCYRTQERGASASAIVSVEVFVLRDDVGRLGRSHLAEEMRAIVPGY